MAIAHRAARHWRLLVGYRIVSLTAAILVSLVFSNSAPAGDLPLSLRLRSMQPLDADREVSRFVPPYAERRLLAIGDSIFVGAKDRIMRIEAHSGKLLAFLPVEGEVGRCLAPVSDGIIFCTSEGQVMRWDGASARARWAVTLDEALGAAILLHGECVAISSRIGNVWCLDPESGKDFWKLGVDEIRKDLRYPVVWITPTRENEALYHRDDGSFVWLSMTRKKNLLNVARASVAELRVRSDPFVVDDTVIYPNEQGASQVFSIHPNAQSGASTIGPLRQIKTLDNAADLWWNDGQLVTWTATGPHSERVISGTMPLAAIHGSGKAVSAAQMMADWDSDVVRIESDGTLWFGGAKLAAPPIQGLASNIVVKRGQRRDIVDFHFVSTGGWLYHYSLVPAGKDRPSVQQSRRSGAEIDTVQDAKSSN